jgi:DUF971 family protein
MQTTPVEIARQDAGHLRIRWQDGHESLYTFAQLRSECPCANCSSKPRRHPGLFLAGTATPTGLEPVGRYAIQISWQDGHAHGIYSFETLRRLCPCAECAARPSRP